MSTGDLVSPFYIEKQVVKIQGIKDAIVVGEGECFISALVMLKKHHAQPPELLRLHIETMNSSLPAFMRVKRFAIISNTQPLKKFPLGTDMTMFKRKTISSYLANSIQKIYSSNIPKVQQSYQQQSHQQSQQQSQQQQRQRHLEQSFAEKETSDSAAVPYNPASLRSLTPPLQSERQGGLSYSELSLQAPQLSDTEDGSSSRSFPSARGSTISASEESMTEIEKRDRIRSKREKERERDRDAQSHHSAKKEKDDQPSRSQKRDKDEQARHSSRKDKESQPSHPQRETHRPHASNAKKGSHRHHHDE